MFFIPSIYRKVRRFIRMSSTPNTTAECEIPPPKAHVDIVYYCTSLQIAYSNDQGPERMEMFTVDEVNLYKTRGASRHEYVSAKVSSSTLPRPVYLAFERVRGEIIDKVIKKDDPNAPPPQAAAESTGASPSESTSPPLAAPGTPSPQKSSFKEKLSVLSTPASTSSKAFSDKVSPTHKADDIVTYLTDETHNKDDECFRTLYFSPPIPLYKLAVLAKTLHVMRRHYLLFSHNCYHYAGTMMKVLEGLDEHNPQLYVDTTGSPEADAEAGLMRIKKGGKKRDQAGTWWFRIPIYDKAEVDPVPLKEEFTEVLKKFTNTVQEFAEQREEGRRAAEAEITRVKKDAEEERKAAEAKQKASDDEITRLTELLKGAGIPIPTPTTTAGL